MEKFIKSDRLDALLAPLALIAVIGWTPVSAQEATPAFTMTVIIDKAHGDKVAAGKYESAIGDISGSKRISDAFAKHTNLCVAYAKTRAIDRATDSCETALTLIREEGQRRKASHAYDRRQRGFLALALSNLGVLDVAKGAPETARARFEEAIGLDTGVPAPRINLARLAVDL